MECHVMVIGVLQQLKNLKRDSTAAIKSLKEQLAAARGSALTGATELKQALAKVEKLERTLSKLRLKTDDLTKQVRVSRIDIGIGIGIGGSISISISIGIGIGIGIDFCTTIESVCSNDWWRNHGGNAANQPF